MTFDMTPSTFFCDQRHSPRLCEQTIQAREISLMTLGPHPAETPATTSKRGASFMWKCATAVLGVPVTMVGCGFATSGEIAGKSKDAVHCGIEGQD